MDLNKGRVYTEDGMVTVKNGIPGQKIRFVVHKKRKNQAEGRLLEVLEKSSIEKRDPVCKYFRPGRVVCQTMLYEDQLAMKARHNKDLRCSNHRCRSVDEEGKVEQITVLKASRAAQWNLPTAIKWNFPSEMRIKTAL